MASIQLCLKTCQDNLMYCNTSGIEFGNVLKILFYLFALGSPKDTPYSELSLVPVTITPVSHLDRDVFRWWLLYLHIGSNKYTIKAGISICHFKPRRDETYIDPQTQHLLRGRGGGVFWKLRFRCVRYVHLSQGLAAFSSHAPFFLYTVATNIILNHSPAFTLYVSAPFTTVK